VPITSASPCCCGIIAVCFEKRKKYTNTLFEQNSELYKCEAGGTFGNDSVVKGWWWWWWWWWWLQLGSGPYGPDALRP